MTCRDCGATSEADQVRYYEPTTPSYRILREQPPDTIQIAKVPVDADLEPTGEDGYFMCDAGHTWEAPRNTTVQVA